MNEKRDTLGQGLRIDTTGLSTLGPLSRADKSANSPSPRHPSFLFSRESPTNRISEENEKPSFTFRSSTDGRAEPPRARNESRKLLAHVLSGLQNRPMPPTYMDFQDEYSTKMTKGFGAVVRTVTDIVAAPADASGRRTRSTMSMDDSDDSSNEETGYTPDGTYNLICQLRDICMLSSTHAWGLFSEDDSQPDTQEIYEKPRSKRRRSSSAVGRIGRSRSASPSRVATLRATDLLTTCISVISSVISEDCRYQISSIRPSRPPNALQAVTMSLAEFLVHVYKHEPRVLSMLGFAVLPAFKTFKPAMHIRLIAFFESILGWILDHLRQLRGTTTPPNPESAAEVSFDEPSSENPVVSIQVDEVQEEPPFATEGWRKWSNAETARAAIRSTTAPDQDVGIYHLSSLIPPLVAAVLESIDLSIPSNPVVQRFHRLFRNLVNEKPDAYLDILSIIAYYTPKARYAAAHLLCLYWPKAVGHFVVSKSFPDVIPSESSVSTQRRGSLTWRASTHDHPYAHQFTPWHFTRSSRPIIFEGSGINDCRACLQPISGFGLLCPFCTCAVHLECYDYPDGSFFTQYLSAPDSEIQKVAVHRFCHVQPTKRDALAISIRMEQHTFRMVNIFSLSLCFICREPLWGYIMQGLKCGGCKQFVHVDCISKAEISMIPRCRSVQIDSTSMTIPYSALRQSFLRYYHNFPLTDSHLRHTTYEELSVFYAVLWTQLEVLNHGITLGSIVVEHNAEVVEGEDIMEPFELHNLVHLYEITLSVGDLPASSSLLEYMSENGLRPHQYTMAFDWNTLAYITSVIKTPAPTENPNPGISSRLLSVDQNDAQGDDFLEDSAYPFEIVSLAHLRDQLGNVLNITSDVAARYLLSHLHHVGLLQRLDSEMVLFEDDPQMAQTQCCSPIALGFDVSIDLETLVSSIETCLTDINLSVNEMGFLLLSRRIWPDGMLSDYTFHRMTKAILSWLFCEDNHLVVILRDYIARSRSLPGVRSIGDPQSWPTSNQSRPTATTANNGGDYVAGRRALLSKYIAPWMLAFHDRDIEKYTTTLFDALFEHAEEGVHDASDLLGVGSEQIEKKRRTLLIDTLLRLLTKTVQASLTFTVFDDLFQKWLDMAETDTQSVQPIPSLTRLFNRDSDGSQRHSVVDNRASAADIASLANVDPLQALISTASSTKEGFHRGLHWLNLFVSSGVDVPIQVFLQLSGLAEKFGASLEECILLSKAALSSSWLRSLGRQDLQATVAALHVYLLNKLLKHLQAAENLADITLFIRLSLATCLLLYGCERSELIALKMVEDADIRDLPSKRKVASRNVVVGDPIIIDSSFMNALGLYVQQGIDEISSLVAKFFNAFVNDAPLLESYEVDNFVLRNGEVLCKCIWEFYGIQLSEISSIRTALLSRVLVVDPQPFQEMLSELFEPHTSWETRLQAALKSFRVIMDILSPALVVEDRQWRPSLVDVFFHFFSSIWADENEEIRVAVDTWSQSLLPAHREAISLCWNEALGKAPISERVKLVSFLIGLHSHFPDWRVLTWEAIIEALLENDFMQGNEDEDAAAAHLSMYGVSSKNRDTLLEEGDPEAILLSVSLVSLSLRMISDGISIDIFSLLRLKDQILRVLGFQDVSLVPSSTGHTFHVHFDKLDTIPSWAHPCISDLMLAMDSSYPYDLSASAMGGPYVEDDTKSSLLVGSVFVDLLLGVFSRVENLKPLPPLTLKNLLKTLIIVLQKHDIESKPLRHLQGNLRTAAEVCLTILTDPLLSYESRQLALTVCHAFIKRWPLLIGNFFVGALEGVAKLLVVLDFEHNPEDGLVIQAKWFIESVLSMFSTGGALNIIFKRRLDDDFFIILRYVFESNLKGGTNSTLLILQETLLRDTLTRAVETDLGSYQLVVDNINKLVQVVYHSYYSANLMQFIGHSLKQFAERAANWTGDAFDPSPLIELACTLIQHNKAQSRELLTYLDIFLRAILIRLHVSASSLIRVLQVTSSLYRKIEPREQAFASNDVAMTLREIVSNGLCNKAKVPAPTLAALIETFTSESGMHSVPPEVLVSLAEDGILYLVGGNTLNTQPDFTVSQAAAKMILQCAENQPLLLGSLMKRLPTVRTWNMILLTSLSNKNGKKIPALLLRCFPTFSQAYHLSLNLLTSIGNDLPELEDVNISRAYIAIKLWFLVARQAANAQDSELNIDESQRVDEESMNAMMIWNDLWPPFETTIHVLQAHPQGANSLLLATTSAADLILFLHQFRSVIGLETAPHKALLTLLKEIGRAESKVLRILRTLNDPIPDLPDDHFTTQISTEIWAEEKLEAAKMHEIEKSLPDRGRRMIA